MTRYALISSLRGLLTLVAVSMIVFALGRVSGNPLDVLTPPNLPRADREAIAAKWGLDRPLPQQYETYLLRAVRGDFGASLTYSNVRVLSLIRSRLPASLELGLAGLALTIAVAIPMGVLSAVKRGTWVDRLAKGIALFGQSVPVFWLGIVFIWVFSVSLGWFPTSGRAGFRSLILPGFLLSLFGTAALIRLLRSSMLEVLGSEFIKLARLKGLSRFRVIWKHALKAAAIDPLTFFGTLVVHLLTGIVVVEVVFSWPGLGLLAFEAADARDFPVVQALALLFSGATILMNLTIDLLYAWLDPRVRLGGRGVA